MRASDPAQEDQPMPHRLPRRGRLACGAVKVAVIGTMLATALGLGPGAAGGAQDPGPVDTRQPMSDHPDPMERKLARHGCSPTGFDSGHQPASALVRSARGRLRFVDFETGWRVYTRHGAAMLVAVCLDDAPAR
jgi:hypothetical protein